jgi:hypothetical protein
MTITSGPMIAKYTHQTEYSAILRWRHIKMVATKLLKVLIHKNAPFIAALFGARTIRV